MQINYIHRILTILFQNVQYLQRLNSFLPLVKLWYADKFACLIGPCCHQAMQKEDACASIKRINKLKLMPVNFRNFTCLHKKIDEHCSLFPLQKVMSDKRLSVVCAFQQFHVGLLNYTRQYKEKLIKQKEIRGK